MSDLFFPESIIPNKSKKDILEQIKKNILTDKKFCHIVSLNPEIIVVASHDKDFQKVILNAEIRIIDGIGVILASKVLKIKAGERLTGVSLAEYLIELAFKERLKIMLIGGRPKIADTVAKCQKKRFSGLKIMGIEGYRDKFNIKDKENKKLFSIVSIFKPHIILVSFGSPFQEKWIFENKRHFKGMTVAGVGGAFDFLSGSVSRAPSLIQNIGLEWLYRLIIQPWRIKRQIRLIEFIALVAKKRLQMV